MAVAWGLLLVAVLLFFSSGLHCSSPRPACPESCTCQRAPLLNCSSSGLSLVPQHIQDSVTELDLSHNLLNSVTLLRAQRNLRNVWLGNNTITHLSLCVERNPGSQYVRDRHLRRSKPWIRRGCVYWAPTLQLLSVERNQLEQLPEGLEGSKFLQVLQLSFNKISILRPRDLRYLRQLKELHLQHNLITSLHPQMFQHLAQLRVLDLSFNMLTSLHPLMYVSLRNIGADVKLDGNRWQCDCSMRSLRRQMAYDNSRSLQTWRVSCASPSILSGKDLLQLEEDDLNCLSTENMSVLHRDVTVYSGSDILLSCSTQDPVWWTPSGQASVSQRQVISDITERHTGLYVCVSEDHRVISVFNLQISKIGGTRRNTRSLPRSNQQIIPQDTPNSIGQQSNRAVTQSDLTLAVCLSVFLTFLIAFIIGVLARPCIDVLWKRVTNKKRSSTTNSSSSGEQSQYDNEAYSSGEGPEEIPIRRERRVTFSTVDIREDNNVHYYDTVARGSQESITNGAVIECEVAVENKHTVGDSGSENTLRQSISKDNQKNDTDDTDESHTHSMKFEHIPDPGELEEKRSLSSCSNSSVSDKVLKENQMTQGDRIMPKSSQLAKDSLQQRPDFSTATKVEMPQISVEGTSEIPGFASEPFAEWSPHTNNTNSADLDLWQENEEQFEFSDSAQSTSARSSIVFGSFNDVAPTSENQKRENVSSSSSYVSEDEPTQYTVNSDQEEEENIERDHKNGDYRDDVQRPPVRPEKSSSSDSSDSDCKPKHSRVKKEREKEEKEQHISEHDKPSNSVVRAEWDTRDKTPSLSSNSSSSSDSEDETKHHADKSGKKDISGLPFQKSPTVSHNSKTQFPAVDLEHIPRTERHLNIKAPALDSDSSSSSDSENETTYQTDRPGKGNIAELPLQKSERHDPHARWPNLDLHIKAPSLASDSSSSSDSEDETMVHTHMPGKVDTAGLQLQEAYFPALDLEHIPHIKRRLDIKAPSLGPDSSSSSDSEDETTVHTDGSGKGDIAELQFQEANFPALDLEHIPHIKRRLDIKAPSLASDSSSSSDSEDETTVHTDRPGKLDIAELQFQEANFPALDLEHIPHIERRLDIKAPSLGPDSSSSSDSEDETMIHTDRPGKVDIAELQFQEANFPALDLEHIPHIERRLDIKAPSLGPDSSSSSDSEDETTGYIEKQRPGKVVISTASYDPDKRWPDLDPERIPRIKRRLDIKTPSLGSDSSSSSDSEDETTTHLKKQGQEEIYMARLPVEITPSVNQQPKTQWPALDFEHSTHIKRRLDIKAPSSPDSTSSSSSDSEDEITDYTGKQRPPKFDITELPMNDRDARWPALDFERLPRIKRRLDIKAPTLTTDSSSSSDSEDETTNCLKKQEQGEIHMAGLPVEMSQTVNHRPETRWPVVDLEHTTPIKRHLDIKAPSPDSTSSSSSDSEDETADHTKMQRPLTKVDISELPLADPAARWPTIDLEHIPHIKRHLDIKVLSPPAHSYSNSDIVEGKVSPIKKHEQNELHKAKHPFKNSEANSHNLDTKWPTLHLEDIKSIKRRLDIKGPSPDSHSSSSSDGEDETTHHTGRPEKVDILELPLQKSETICHDPETQWPMVNLGNITRIKRRLDVKSPSPPDDLLLSGGSTSHTVEENRKEANKISPYYSTSSSGEEEEGVENLSKPPIKIKPDPYPRWPELDLSSATHVKRCLDIKALRGSSSSSESDGETTNLKVERDGSDHRDVGITKNEQQATLNKLKLGIKATSPQPDLVLSSVSVGSQQSSSSSSESEDEKTNLNTVVGMGLSAASKASEKEFIRFSKTPLVNISSSSKTDPNITLEKYTVITNNSSSISTYPELHSKWATMNLGISRFRKRLDITSRAPPSSFSSENEGNTWRETSELPVVTDKETSQNHTSQSKAHKVERMDKVELKSEILGVAAEYDSILPQLSLTNIPTVKRALDIRAPLQTESSSSSNSEHEMIHHGVPDLSLGIPRIKRRLNIKGPYPEQSDSPSSSSEDETMVKTITTKESRHSPNMSGMTDNDSVITYKRLIMKAQSIPSKSQSTHQAEMVTVAQEGPSHSVGDINESLSQRRALSIRLDDAGVKRRNDDSRSTRDVDLPPQIRWTGISRHLPDLSVSSSRRNLDVDLSSPQLAPASTKFANTNEILRGLSEQRREKKGLSALKVMSLQRKKWDTDDEALDHGPQHDTGFNYHRSEEDIKVLAKQPLKQLHHSSTSSDERRAADLLYGIPRYRRHDTGDIEPPQESPPPVPATPPPDEALELTWRSPQRSKITTRHMEESPSLTEQNLGLYFDPSKMSISDV